MTALTGIWLSFAILSATSGPTLVLRGLLAEGRSLRTRYPGPTPESERLHALGGILKRHVAKLRSAPRAELVFLVDSSASVGAENFVNELRFVRKLLADFTVSRDRTRVSLVTFSSKKKVVREVDHITLPSFDNHKCALHNRQLAGVKYSGGGTFTLGAMKEAMDILKFAREDAAKAVFLVTDGYSNGGDPRPCAKMLRDSDVTIYTFGIRNGNVRELQDMASTPYDEHCYILDSFEEFEALARRALHEDMHVGPYQLVNATECAGLCPEGHHCCDHEELCTCGISSGQYACLCPKGYYGSGLREECHPCPQGTYQPVEASGDESICIPCPHAHQNSLPGSTSVAQCHCKRGYSTEGGTCKGTMVRCDPLSPPDNGYMVNADCEVVFNAACGFRCNPGYRLIGNSIRVCQHDGNWSGSDPVCEKKKCSPLESPLHGSMSCSSDSFDFDTTCEFECQRGYALIGSRKRTCLSIALWDGLPVLCRPVTCPPLVAPTNGALSPPHCSETKSSYGEDCTVMCDDGYRVMGPVVRHCLSTGMWSEPDDVTICARAHDVLYSAEDEWGNMAFCNFTVTVADKEPPFVENCFDPPEAFSDGQSSVHVSWEEPAFSDNSGEDVKLWQSHSPGVAFPVGETMVTYVATDTAGNNASCVINITVRENRCSQIPHPANGNADCQSNTFGITCTISCLDGYKLEPDSPRKFSCTFKDGWAPYQPQLFSDCSESVPSTSAAVNARMLYSAPLGLECDETMRMDVRDHIDMKLASQLSVTVVVDVLGNRHPKTEGKPQVLRQSRRIAGLPPNPSGLEMSHNANEHRPLSTSAPTSSAPQLRDVRPFAGRPDEDAEAWLIYYKRVSAANKWDAASQLLYVAFFLTDSALMWYENREETLTTWDRFVSEIKERFGDPTTIKKRAEQTLMQRAQVPGETCTTYIEEVIKLCRTIDPGMSEEDKVGHILKGIAEDVYSFLIAKDTLTSVTDVIRHCRTFEQPKTRRITPKFGRLPNVTTITSIDSNQALNLASTIRQIVREELDLYAQVANRPSTHPPYHPPEFERNVASFSSHRVAEGFEDSDATPQYQPNYTIAALPMTHDHDEHSHILIHRALSRTTSRCGKDSTNPTTKM
ncbi:hypothetical protein HPB51_004484 [Rhipicephalus microplus]|uniref:Uncharacterized protein n=1 Tax=Rhipicephalus microplus TaxID=6941 RepID=A0A9J6EL83_RHIMP|nr:hypothetical protein HPB51_004484 [Rhipicephalus microplus]